MRFLVPTTILAGCYGPGDPCAGIDCSGHGTCISNGPDFQCYCDGDWAAAGTECLPDERDGTGPEGCLLLQDTFSRPDAETLGGAEEPTGAVWREEGALALRSASLVGPSGSIGVAECPHWETDGSAVRLRFVAVLHDGRDAISARFGAHPGDDSTGLGVTLLGPDRPSTEKLHLMQEGVSLAAIPATFEPWVEYHVEVVVADGSADASVATGGYGSEGGIALERLRVESVVEGAGGSFVAVRLDSAGDGAEVGEVSLVRVEGCE